jgi:hypothetical protein
MKMYSAAPDRFFHVGGEAQPALGYVTLDDGLQARLPDRDDACLELFDLAPVDVHADDGMADLCKAGPRYQANVAGAEDGDFHGGLVCSGMAACRGGKLRWCNAARLMRKSDIHNG